MLTGHDGILTDPIITQVQIALFLQHPSNGPGAHGDPGPLAGGFRRGGGFNSESR
jgi:hypothetical protein